jgi:hypothetical protein
MIFAASFLVCAASANAEFWRHPEIAGKNSLFADVGLAPLVFDGMEFPVLPLEIRVDWLPPLPLPFSAGLFLKTPNPNLNSFGVRLGYHFDLRLPMTDLFFAYVFDFGFVRNDILEKYNDNPVPIHWYDFRVGVRHFFGPIVGLALESDFKAGGIILMLSIKTH